MLVLQDVLALEPTKAGSLPLQHLQLHQTTAKQFKNQ
jgi:hypothetical protein